MKIREVGFSGIAGTTWEEDVLMTSARSNDGVLYVDTWRKSGRTAQAGIWTVDQGSGKPFFTGPMIPASSNYRGQSCWNNVVFPAHDPRA